MWQAFKYHPEQAPYNPRFKIFLSLNFSQLNIQMNYSPKKPKGRFHSL